MYREVFLRRVAYTKVLRQISRAISRVQNKSAYMEGGCLLRKGSQALLNLWLLEVKPGGVVLA